MDTVCQPKVANPASSHEKKKNNLNQSKFSNFVSGQDFEVPTTSGLFVQPGDMIGIHYDNNNDRAILAEDFVSLSRLASSCNPCTDLRTNFLSRMLHNDAQRCSECVEWRCI